MCCRCKSCPWYFWARGETAATPVSKAGAERQFPVRIRAGPQNQLDAGAAATMMRACPSHIDARPVEDPLAHYVICRVDLPMGVAAAQIVHAAGESATGPVPPDTFAIVLAVPGEAQLMELASKIAEAGLEHRVIVETDGPHAGQAMTIGVRPDRRSALRRHFSSLPLFGRVAQSRAPGATPEVAGSRPASPAILPGSSNGGHQIGSEGLNPSPGANSVSIAQEAERQA